MAQYFDDCSALTNWSGVGWSSGSFAIDTGNILATGSSSGTNILNLNLINSDGDRDDIECYFEFRRTLAATYREVVAVRGSGNSSTGTAYIALINDGNLRVSRNTTPNATTVIASAAKSLTTTGVDYACLFRVNGSDIKLKVWELPGSEPGSWDIETTDSNVTAAGFAGPTSPDANIAGARYYKWGVGTNGDAAPTSAGGVALPTLSALTTKPGTLTSTGFTTRVTAS